MRIDIKGIIIPNDDLPVYEFLAIDCTAPQQIQTTLEKAKGEKLDVYINSAGGAVFAGQEIYSELRAYKGDVTIHITGLCGSIASVIAMARHSVISPSSELMIHNVSALAEGDSNELRKTAQTLDTLNLSIAQAYTEKTGKPIDEVLSMMNEEAWLTAPEAVSQGFVDEIEASGAGQVRYAASVQCGLLPQATIDKIKNELVHQRAQKKTELLNTLNHLRNKK